MLGVGGGGGGGSVQMGKRSEDLGTGFCCICSFITRVGDYGENKNIFQKAKSVVGVGRGSE